MTVLSAYEKCHNKEAFPGKDIGIMMWEVRLASVPTDGLVAGDRDPDHSYHVMGYAGAHAGGGLCWLQVTP